MTKTVSIWDDFLDDCFEEPFVHGELDLQAARQHQFRNLTLEQALEYEAAANDN